jgi:DNA-binding response OmpR family regulator
MSATVLIVDDDKALNNMIAAALRAEGHQVIQEFRGSSGLRTALREKPDLIVLDAITPDVQGFEVLREVTRRRLRTRVIVYTATVRSTREIVKFLREGACDYVEKGGNLDALINAVERALTLELTLDKYVASPIVNEMMVKVTELERENAELRRVVVRQPWVAFATRALLAILAVIILIVLTQLKVVTVQGRESLLMVGLVFGSLLLPLEKLAPFLVKAVGGWAIVDLNASEPGKRKQSRQPPTTNELAISEMWR